MTDIKVLKTKKELMKYLQTRDNEISGETQQQENSKEESHEGMIQNPMTGKWSFGII